MQEEKFIIQEIIKNLELEDIYDVVRIIDPIKKKVFNLIEDRYEEDVKHCFSYWPNNSICSNCVSMRAFREDKVFTRIEKTLDTVHLTISKPVKINHERFVVEMIKDISDILIEHKNNDEVIRDSITDTYNRRFLEERIQADIFMANEENKNLSILFINVDDLKTINRKYGHSTGDGVLAEIANEIEELISSRGSWVTRYGGDEFFICLMDFNKEEACRLAEKMRKNIETRLFFYCNESYNVTISIGVSEISNDISSYEELLDSADKSLQIAKNKGKNRVVFNGYIFSETTNI